MLARSGNLGLSWMSRPATGSFRESPPAPFFASRLQSAAESVWLELTIVTLQRVACHVADLVASRGLTHEQRKL